MSVLKFSPELNRKIRSGDWDDLRQSTYRKIQDAIESEQISDAIEYVDYFHEEALVCKNLYDQWIRDGHSYLLLKGYGETELNELTQRINTVIGSNSGYGIWDREKGWEDYLQRLDVLKSEIGKQSENVLESLYIMKEAWRVSHDMDVDYLLGLFDAVKNAYGEAAIGEMYEEYLIKDWFEKRYAAFDISNKNWDDIYPLLVFLSFEAMHGHLCGIKREGDVEYKEYEDRIEMEFDPCGSGGRAQRGEPLDNTPSRMAAPYHYGPIENPYDFTWNKKGICTYCAHCCVLTEKMPAEQFGYPVRVVEPPSYPHEKEAKCKYIIYKDPRDVPDYVYKRVGLTKPGPDQALGSHHGPFKEKAKTD